MKRYPCIIRSVGPDGEVFGARIGAPVEADELPESDAVVDPDGSIVSTVYYESYDELYRHLDYCAYRSWADDYDYEW